MIEPVTPPGRRNIPVSPQLALRVTIMGGIALALFAIVFFRLWYLQVLSGDQYRAQAQSNQLRRLPIPAPRGQILDRSGAAIVTDRETNAVQVVPAQLPPAGHARIELYQRLGRVLHMPWRRVQALVIAGRQSDVPYADVTIKVDTSYGVLTYLGEHQQLFPGVSQGQITIRSYPYGGLAAQVLGYVGQVTKTELGQSSFRGVTQGTVVGQYGLEGSYDSTLRGTPGEQRIRVNSEGQYEGTLAPVAPVAGHDLRVTLDLGLEKEGDKALQQGMGLAHGFGNPATAGAFVALDPRNGDVLAMGSAPTFDPNMFAKPFTQSEYNKLLASTGEVNRAIAGLYPTGSTFKPITALAGLQAGLIAPGTELGAGACVTVSHERFCNALHTDYGSLDLENALKVSEDTYFYKLGALANPDPDPAAHQQGVVQKMARALGLGALTGVDLTGEQAGVVPDPAWRASRNALEAKCHCGVANGAPWTIGDNIQLATGQGDLLATPLQMAVVYSALANAYTSGDGVATVPVPHLASQIDDTAGSLLQLIQPLPARTVHLDPADVDVVMDGLHAATSQPGGTSSDVWAGFPVEVFGKTGTAEHQLANGSFGYDQAWYVCYLPSKTRPIVIAVTIEKGGFGDQSAAPVARLMASEWFNQPEKLVRGSSATL